MTDAQAWPLMLHWTGHPGIYEQPLVQRCNLILFCCPCMLLRLQIALSIPHHSTFLATRFAFGVVKLPAWQAAVLLDAGLGAALPGRHHHQHFGCCSAAG
jgi:hypothetical protein